MRKDEIIRAWKDEEFRRGLSAEEQSSLPENPAGLIDLTDAQAGEAVGGVVTIDAICGAITVATAVSAVLTDGLSCTPTCPATVVQGTCAIYSSGCCTNKPGSGAQPT